MSCHHPFKAFRTGYLTEKGKDDFIVLCQNDDYLRVDLAKKHKPVSADVKKVIIGDYEYLCDPVPIPCGKCIGCRLDRAKMWTTRCVLEARYHKYVYFITLTYSDNALPFDKDGSAILVKKDLQDFFKRLRFNLGVKFRYFACGEYGGQTSRPHYHAILFLDQDIPDLKPSGVNSFKSAKFAKSWPFGLYDISIAETGCMAYVAGYVVKKAKYNTEDFPVAPFVVMSRKPGLGAMYLQDHDILSTMKVYGDFGSVRSAPVPRYFKDKLGDEYLSIKDRLVEEARKAVDIDIGVFQEPNESLRGSIKDDLKYRDLEDLKDDF